MCLSDRRGLSFDRFAELYDETPLEVLELIKLLTERVVSEISNVKLYRGSLSCKFSSGTDRIGVFKIEGRKVFT